MLIPTILFEEYILLGVSEGDKLSLERDYVEVVPCAAVRTPSQATIGSSHEYCIYLKLKVSAGADSTLH